MKNLITSLVFFTLVGTMPAAIALEMYRFNLIDSKASCETDIECCVAYNDCEMPLN
jgi:hypothetical protein